MIGKKFNKLTVVGRGGTKIYPSGRTDTIWLCRCECGKETKVVSNALKRTQSCGCVRGRNLANKRFGRLIVISREAHQTDNHWRWKCQCDCGNITLANSNQLTQGKKKSCGCSMPSKEDHYLWRGHGDITGTYWSNITRNARTRNIQVKITIKDIWKLFLKQKGVCALTGLDIELGKIGTQTASLDRIDSSKPYTLDNVQWVHKEVNTMKSQLSEPRFLELCKLISRNQHDKKQEKSPKRPKDISFGK